ncbi:Serine-threonine protein kinase [Entamoeba marina]
MKFIHYLPLFIILNVFSVSAYLCSPGCIDDCVADYTCTQCYESYDQDNSCLTCKLHNYYEEYDEVTNPVYTEVNNSCSIQTNIVNKSNWLPETGVTELHSNEKYTLEFNDDSMFDYGPCYDGSVNSKYLRSEWFSLNTSNLSSTTTHIHVTISFKTNFNKETVYFEVTNSNPEDDNVFCYTKVKLSADENYSVIELPIDYGLEGHPFFYFFIHTEIPAITTVEILVEGEIVRERPLYFTLDKTTTDDMLKTNASVRIIFPMSESGITTYSSCAYGTVFKVLRFAIIFQGDFSVLIDTTESNRIWYLQEYNDTDEINEASCVNFWEGKGHGILNKFGVNNGLRVRLSGNNILQNRTFALLSNDFDRDIPVTFSVICPNDCNSYYGYGYCSSLDGYCLCNEGYGGSDCHLLCYYNNKWQVDNITNLCYFGEDNCDDYCSCEDGYQSDDHYCVSNECLNNNLESDELECYRGSEGCQPNCKCENDLFTPSATKKQCIPKTCGNTLINTVIDSFGNTRIEECDGGTNCEENCYCSQGFVTDTTNTTNCVTKTMSIYVIVASSCGIFIVFILVLFALFFLIAFLFITNKNNDLSLYKQQQPPYYLYLTGSQKIDPVTTNKYRIDPIELDFGNDDLLTNVNDTRFQRITVKNKSKKKWMLLIIHTPTNPKFVFHFEPQTIIMRPRSTENNLKAIMTIFCTTKIKEMKIPYSVWFSQHKSKLQTISNLLKDKTFETWDEDNQNQIEKELKHISFHGHHSFTIKTETASSIHLDMDELNISEEPVAEGATGKVFIGEYRSIPVAIKQFRWENLSENETKELKLDVINECEMMSKLRNPFIASYMGSITYIPQISMVMHYFVLGSLGEYLRKDSTNYLKLSYKLKIKMLFDTARGMSFLHENQIMHLDLKPDNLLVNSLYYETACCIKITDFGTSRVTKKVSKLTDKGLGTPIYISPEAYNDTYTYAGDVYSFGITSWEIFYQDEPFKEYNSLFEIKDAVKNNKRPIFDNDAPQSFVKLVKQCWENDPELRPTFTDIVCSLVKISEEASKNSNISDDAIMDEIDIFIENRNRLMNKRLNGIN